MQRPRYLCLFIRRLRAISFFNNICEAVKPNVLNIKKSQQKSEVNNSAIRCKIFLNEKTRKSVNLLKDRSKMYL